MVGTGLSRALFTAGRLCLLWAQELPLELSQRRSASSPLNSDMMLLSLSVDRAEIWVRTAKGVWKVERTLLTRGCLGRSWISRNASMRRVWWPVVFQECIDQSCLVAGGLPVVTDLLYSAIRPDQMDLRGLACRSLNAVAGGIDNPIGDDRLL